MGGSNNHRQTKNKATSSSFSLFGCLKRPKQHRRDDGGRSDNALRPEKKAWRSDCWWCYVAKPGIDDRAKAFIDNFHETRASKPECHTINA